MDALVVPAVATRGLSGWPSTKPPPQGDSADAVREAVRALFPWGNVHQQGRYGQTWLLAAIGSRDVAAVTALLDHGADPRVTDLYGRSPLQKAMEVFRGADRLSLVRLLLSRGSLVTSELHVALCRGWHDVVQTLLHHGASPSPQYIFSQRVGHTDWAVPHALKAAPLSPLQTALITNNVQLARQLVNAGFLTKQDISPDRTTLMILKEFLGSRGWQEALEFTRSLYSEPLSLRLQAMATVSKMAGEGSERATKIEQSGLPTIIVNALLFKSKKALDENESDENS